MSKSSTTASTSHTSKWASVSVDKTARIWNIQKNVSDAEFYNGAVLGDGTFPNSTLLRAAFFADDKWVCAVGITGDVYFWPVPAESSKDPLPPYIAGGVHRGRIAVLQPYKRPEDKKFPIMATAGHDGTVRIWDLFKLAEKLNVLDSPGRGASELVSSIINDVSYVIQTNRDARNNAEINDVDFYERNLADGRKELWLISAGGDGELRFINLATIDHDRGPSQSRAVDLSAQNHFVGDGHRNAIVDIAIRQDKHLLLTGGSDGKVYVWNLSDLIDKWQPTEMVEHRNASQELSGHSSSITDITLTVDGQWAITSGDDNFVRIWSLSSKTAAKKPADYEICLPNRVGVLSVVPKSVHDQVGAVVSGDLLVVGCDDELVRVWKFSNRDRSWLDWEQKNLYTKLPQKIDPSDVVAQRQNAGSAASSDPSGSRREMLQKKSNQELAELCRELVSLHWGKEAVEEWLDTH
jgi:WD40 repeat protein